jgi:hypothetical protein
MRRPIPKKNTKHCATEQLEQHYTDLQCPLLCWQRRVARWDVGGQPIQNTQKVACDFFDCWDWTELFSNMAAEAEMNEVIMQMLNQHTRQGKNEA